MTRDGSGMSMNAAELAALIAAVFWALLVCVGVFVLFKLGTVLVREQQAGRRRARARRRAAQPGAGWRWTERSRPWTGPGASSTGPKPSRPAWTNSAPG